MIAHILDARPVWIKEFASALSAVTPTIGWCPEVSNTGRIRDYEKETLLNWSDLRNENSPIERKKANPDPSKSLFIKEGDPNQWEMR